MKLKKLHNEELHNVCSSTDITRTDNSGMMRWGRHVPHMTEMRILVGKPERKRSLGKRRLRWEDINNIRIDFREIVWEDD
jgi:hypothetical protein